MRRRPDSLRSLWPAGTRILMLHDSSPCLDSFFALLRLIDRSQSRARGMNTKHLKSAIVEERTRATAYIDPSGSNPDPCISALILIIIRKLVISFSHPVATVRQWDLWDLLHIHCTVSLDLGILGRWDLWYPWDLQYCVSTVYGSHLGSLAIPIHMNR